MPELPEVQTTVNGLQKHVVGLKIADVWSNYNSPYFKGSKTIKDPSYFKHLKKELIGAKITAVKRRAKNILIYTLSSPRFAHLSKKSKPARNEKILLIHMKMTGHLLYGTYHFDPSNKKDPWVVVEPKSLKDPFNRHVHFVISFSNGKQLALSDVRKFAKVTIIDAENMLESDHIKHIGPEPLEKSFDFPAFAARLNLKPNGKIKQVLTDQRIIAGIGNIYADESLWHSGIHPSEKVGRIDRLKWKQLFKAIKTTLSKGVDLGGDSTSDYRNVLGEKGSFHETHHAYQRTGMRCDKKGCGGIINRMLLGGRSAHFCDMHQKLVNKRMIDGASIIKQTK